jgi:lysophospholipase L1-like esterase
MSADAAMQRVDLIGRRDLLRGVCDAVEIDGAAAFFRHTPAVRERYSRPLPRLRRAYSSAGVRIAFRSDTTALRLALRCGDGVEWVGLAKCDLFVDGTLASFFGPDRPEIGTRWSGLIWRAPDARMREFLLWLPTTRQLLIESLEIDAGAQLQPAPRPARNWLVLGDSITQGYVTAHPSDGYAALTAAALGLDHHNTAVGGGTADPALADLARGIEADLITVAFGVNDYSHADAREQFEHNVHDLLTGLRAARPDARILWITPIPYVGFTRRPNRAGLLLADYTRLIFDQAARVDRIEVLDGYPFLPDAPEWFVDNCHPNEPGHALYARALTRALARETK